ncbi:sigma-70 family RNA polymerase sigma factor [Roseibium salinum]|uniref:Sigma-70 family RNA polymerase sigma factor n=1 Tax=Roseibium salinum TaxID=1604349 RepID=A0ABT3QX34_9HYPH|nr:sigma-70 family RNA polymerase sigma factor [Roseibium sp. DSM 29163]MCX2721430.1 sigma-70 family RNA polymerase sigma factor [Roseibium sp. DSM 29163]
MTITTITDCHSDLMETMIDHREQLIALASRILGARDRAEDVVQDAMLKACAARRGLCPDCPKRFACRMVRNLAIDTLRRKELENRACSRIVKDNLVDTVQADSHAQLESSQLIAVLAGTLAALPERTRNAFVLHRLEGVPQKEIAARFGLSPARIHTLIRDAGQACVQAVAREG